MTHTRSVLGAIASALLTGCAIQPPAPAPYVPAAVVNPPPKHVDVPPDPMAALPVDIRNAILSGQPHTVRQGITTTFPTRPTHSRPSIAKYSGSPRLSWMA